MTISKKGNWQGGPVKRVCKVCETRFEVDKNVVLKGNGLFCSRSCAAKNPDKKRKKGEMVALVCIVCKTKFQEYKSHLKAEPNRGKCCSKKCRGINHSKTTNGSKSHRWKGGLTKRETLVRARMVTRTWAKAIKARDNMTCQICGTKKYKTSDLHAHHITPWCEKESLWHSMDNGKTLCVPCHLKEHK